jgi:hypothetical protein
MSSPFSYHDVSSTLVMNGFMAFVCSGNNGGKWPTLSCILLLDYLGMGFVLQDGVGACLCVFYGLDGKHAPRLPVHLGARRPSLRLHPSSGAASSSRRALSNVLCRMGSARKAGGRLRMGELRRAGAIMIGRDVTLLGAWDCL